MIGTDKLKAEASQRLKEHRKVRLGIDAKTAARRAGVALPTYYQFENGTRLPAAETAVQISESFGFSLDEWLSGATHEGQPAPYNAVTEVPFISWISAGAMQQEDLRDEALGSMRVANLPPGDWIALEVKGDSMDRISPPSSRILVNRRDKSLVPNACYVIDDGYGNATYKRYRPAPMRFEPVSTNPAHEPLFPDNEPTIVGRVHETILRL